MNATAARATCQTFPVKATEVTVEMALYCWGLWRKGNCPYDNLAQNVLGITVLRRGLNRKRQMIMTCAGKLLFCAVSLPHKFYLYIFVAKWFAIISVMNISVAPQISSVKSWGNDSVLQEIFLKKCKMVSDRASGLISAHVNVYRLKSQKIPQEKIMRNIFCG